MGFAKKEKDLFEIQGVDTMSPDFIVKFFQDALILSFYISAPMLILGMLVGLVVSIFQAMTQINEQTLTFIPKLVAAALGFIYFGPFMIEKLMTFTTSIFSDLGGFIR